MTEVLSNRDIVALIYVDDHKSITELAQNLGISVGAAYKLLRNLEESGLVKPPPRARLARSRTLTLYGKEMLAKWLPSISTTEGLQ